jgi:hypothetical protein
MSKADKVQSCSHMFKSIPFGVRFHLSMRNVRHSNKLSKMRSGIRPFVFPASSELIGLLRWRRWVSGKMV